MAMDPEFFTPRHHAQLVEDEAEVEGARRTLLAAVEVALLPAAEREAAAGPTLRALRSLYYAMRPAELIGLTFPLDHTALVDSLGQPCGAWLPYAGALGVADERLLLLGFPTAGCREIRDRLG